MKNKKIIKIIFFISTISLFCFSLNAMDLTQKELNWIEEHPVIRIAPDPEFPPIEWFDENNNYKGITADFMKIIADALDIEFEVVQCQSWNEILQKAKSREIDLLPAAAQTPNRAKYMFFSDPYLIFPGVIITTKSNKNLISTDKLFNKKVGIVSGYVWHEFFNTDHPDIEIIGVANIVEGLRKVSINEIDAFIATLPIALYYIEQEGIPNLIVSGETEYETKLSIQTRKDWPILNSIMTKALKTISPEKKKDIINNWIYLKPMTIFSNSTFWIIVLSVFLLAVFIIMVIIIWNTSLKKQVKLKTKELKEDIARRIVVEEKLKESEQFLNSILNSVQDGVSVLKLDLTIRHVNEIMNKWYKENVPLEGKKCYKVYHNLDKHCKPCPTLRCLKSGKTEWNIVPGPPDSSVKWLELFSYPIIDSDSGEITGVVEFVRNITERKKIEEELVSGRERLKMLNQIIRHDLSNDFLVIKSAINIFKRTSDTTMFDEIGKRVKKSLKTIANYRKYESFIDSNQSLKEIEVNKLISDIIIQFPEVTFNIEGKCNVFADDALHSVFENLISNSIKHGDSTKIDIIITSENDVCKIKFIDNGSGIPDKIKGKIFDEGFSYGKSAHTGIGLHIVKKTIESYDGVISLVDYEISGTAFVISLRKAYVIHTSK